MTFKNYEVLTRIVILRLYVVENNVKFDLNFPVYFDQSNQGTTEVAALVQVSKYFERNFATRFSRRTL